MPSDHWFLVQLSLEIHSEAVRGFTAARPVFIEVFPISTYQDISAAEWLAHTPSRLVDEHIHTGEDFLRKIPKKESVIVPV